MLSKQRSLEFIQANLTASFADRDWIIERVRLYKRRIEEQNQLECPIYHGCCRVLHELAGDVKSGGDD